MGKPANSFKVHSIGYNVIMNTILKLSAVVFPLITFPYTSRVLMAEGNGKIAFASSAVSYFSMLASLGIPTYGIKAVAQNRDNKEKLSRTVHELFFINFICITISVACFIVSMLLVERFQQEKSLMYINALTIIMTPLGAEWFFQGIEQYDYITIRNLVFKIISIILMFILVHQKEDYLIYGTISVFASVGSNIFNFIKLRRYIYCKPIGNYNVNKHLKPVFTLFLLTVTTTIYTHLDSVMLGFMSTDVEVGYYNAAVKTKGILLSLVTALGAVLLPRASYYVEKKLMEEFRAIIRKSIKFTFMAGLSVSVYFIYHAFDAIRFLSGDGYDGAVLAMQIITPTILFVGLNNITGMQILVPFNKEKLTTISTAIGAVLDIVFNSIFIPVMGAAGAALGTMLTEVMVLAIQVLMIGKDIFQYIDGIDLLKSMLAVGIGTLSLVAINTIQFPGYFIKLAITAIVFFNVVVLVLLLCRETIILEIKDKVIRIIGKKVRRV